MRLVNIGAGLLALAAASCAREAGSSGGGGQAAAPLAPAGARSVEGESCAATRDCEPPLRCVAAACVRPVAARLAEYQIAAGDADLARGDGKAAAARFERALAELEAAKEAVPAHVLCASAHAALLAAGRDKVGLERAARALHRCALTAPAAGRERTAALVALAGLEKAGLNPDLVARGETVDAYLTVAPARPPAEDLRVTLEAPAATDKASVRFFELVRSDAARTRIASCYPPFWDETHSDKMSVGLRFKLRYYQADEEADDKALLDIEPTGQAAADPPALTRARTCVSEAVRAAAADYLKTVVGARFQHDTTIIVAP